MASPGVLVATVASVLALPEVHVGSYYRTLREAKLVSKSGRGTSAAEATYLDAARLLIAIMGSALVKDAAQAVEMFGQFGSTIAPSEDGWQDTDPYLPDMPNQKRFEDALAYLLSRSSIDFTHPDMIGRDFVDIRTFWMVKIEVNALIGVMSYAGGDVRYVHDEDDRGIAPDSPNQRDPSNPRLPRTASESFKRLLAEKFDGLGTIRYVRWRALEKIGLLVGGH